MILQIKDLRKTFVPLGGSQSVEVLKGIQLEVTEGDTVAILGQSGSGKSTLLSLLAGLDLPTSGQIILKQENIAALSESELTAFRAQQIGIIFQQYHLMSHLTAEENVSLPLELAGVSNPESKAREALEQVGLSHRLQHFPHQLSGGESQRVAIARAVVIRPALLLADEPTGNLDEQTGDHVADQLFDLVQSHGMTLLLVTHNKELAQRCNRSFSIKEGIFHEALA